MDKKLTLVITLKDRFEFTKRLCKYLEDTNYPYMVYFADGSVGDENEDFFNTLKTNKFLYKYKRFPKDLTLHDYYKKCSQAVNDINTPYVMFADNDDFPISTGQANAVDFLENNLDFVGCNGRIAGISLFPDTSQANCKNILFHKYYCQIMDKPTNLSQSSGIERICSYLSNFHSIFYCVFRVRSLITTLNLIEELNFSDLGIHELFFSYMQLAQGKVNNIQNITYVRQKGSSQSAASQRDWFHRLFYTDWLASCKKAIHVVSEYISKNEKIDFRICYDNLYSQFVNRMRKRYIPNQVLIYINLNTFLVPSHVCNLFLFKLSQIFPSLAEKISVKLHISSQVKYFIEWLYNFRK